MINNLISLRFDGLEATQHKVELSSLSESLKGASKLISTVASFTVSQKFSKRQPQQEVSVYIVGSRANCFTIDIVLDFLQQHQILSGSFSAVFSTIITYILYKNSKNKEMKHLKDSLDKAITELGNRDQKVIDSLVKTIDKMADYLKPAVRQVVTPIGKSCENISVINNNEKIISYNFEDKEILNDFEDGEVLPTATYSIYITELDAINKTAKIILEGDEKNRIQAQISDPVLDPYMMALQHFSKTNLSLKSKLKVLAKATIKNSQINKLYISDIV